MSASSQWDPAQSSSWQGPTVHAEAAWASEPSLGDWLVPWQELPAMKQHFPPLSILSQSLQGPGGTCSHSCLPHCICDIAVKTRLKDAGETRGHQSPRCSCLPFHKPPSSHREAGGLEFKLEDPISMLAPVQWRWRWPWQYSGRRGLHWLLLVYFESNFLSPVAGEMAISPSADLVKGQHPFALNP